MKLSTFRQYLTWKRLRLVGLALLLLLAGFTLYLDIRVRDAFEGRRFALPARLYARPLELFPGLKLTPEALTQELARLGYKEPLAGDERREALEHEREPRVQGARGQDDECDGSDRTGHRCLRDQPRGRACSLSTCPATTIFCTSVVPS